MPDYRDNYRERDEMGRFTSDNEGENRSRRGERYGGETESDRLRRGERYGGEEESRYARRGERYGGEDESRIASRRGNGGERGWFGDSEGHSEAARSRWGDGEFSRSREGNGGGRYYEGGSERPSRDSGGYSRYYGGEEGYRSRRARQDFGDEEGSDSNYARRGTRGGDEGYSMRPREDEGRGWYGNYEGRSEATRRGWEER